MTFIAGVFIQEGFRYSVSRVIQTMYLNKGAMRMYGEIQGA